MAEDINDSIEKSGNSSTHLVYKDGVRVRYPDANNEIFLGILPAIDPEGDPDSFLPYRNPDTGKFNNWAKGAYYYPFVNREKSILSPKTLDPDSYDPLEEIFKTARSNPKWAEIAGFEKDGKKRLPEAYKNQEVKLSSKTQVFVMNGITLYDKDYEQDEVYIFQTPSTAFKGQQGSSTEKRGSWGLISELARLNRGAKEDADLDTKYFWGDITNPERIVPVRLSQEKPPTGSGIKIYNLVPQDEDTVSVGSKVLAARYNLDDIFYPIEEKEILDYLISTFAHIPELLKAAFSARIPNIEKLISKKKVSYSFAEDSEPEDEVQVDEDEEFEPKKAVRRSERKVEPADEDPEPTGQEEEPKQPATRGGRKFQKPTDEEPKEASPKRGSLRDLIED